MQLEDYFERDGIDLPLILKQGKVIKLSEFLCLCGNISDKDFVEYGITYDDYNRPLDESQIRLSFYKCDTIITASRVVIFYAHAFDFYELNDRLTFSDIDYCKRFIENEECAFLRHVFPREDGIDVDETIAQISDKLKIMISTCGLPLAYAYEEYGPDITNDFSFGDKSIRCSICLRLNRLGVNEGHGVDPNKLPELYIDTQRNIKKMKSQLINYKIDLGKYIVVFNNKLDFTYDIRMHMGSGTHTYTYIDGYSFSFGFDIYTSERYYEYGSRGFCELKLLNLNPKNPNFNPEELVQWANEVLSLEVEDIDDIYTQLEQWVHKLTLRKLNRGRCSKVL